MPLSRILQSLWRRKLPLIAVPALLSMFCGVWLYLSPRTYRSQISYAIQINAPTLQKMVDRFYSKENLVRLAQAMKREGLTETSDLVLQLESRSQAAAFFSLRATPDYIDYAQKQNMKLSFERTWAENIEKLEQLTAEFLTLDVKGISEKEMPGVLAVLRNNLEAQLPLYRLQDHWVALRTKTQLQLSERDALKQALTLELQLLEDSLAKLQTLPNTTIPDNFQLQFQISPKEDGKPFLPLPLTIQNYQTQIAEKKALMDHRERRYLLDNLYDQLLIDIIQAAQNQIDQHGTLASLAQNLEELKSAQDAEPAREFLSSHQRYLRTLSLQHQALTRQASTFPVAKGTVQKTIFLFCILFIAGVLIVSIEDFLAYQGTQLS